MIGQIDIIGEITPDTFVNVVAQYRAIADASEIQVNIDSPGGNEAVSDKIASFLDTLGKKITTVQTGIVASAAVKIFLKGQIRKANANYPFLIHNTHIDPQDIPVNLDANNSQALANMLQESRTSLASFYAKATGNSEQAIIAVMDQDQPMNANQAVALGFATEVTSEIPILAKMNMNKIQEFIKKIKGDHIANAAPAPAQAPVKSEDYVIGQPFVMNGKPVTQDGEYPLPDGRIVVVTNGVISEIETDVPPAQVAAIETNLTALAEAVSNLTEKIEAKLDEKLKLGNKVFEDALDAKIKALKSEIVSGGQPPKASTQSNEWKKSHIQAHLESKRK